MVTAGDAARTLAAVRAGHAVMDRDFDQIYPEEIRRCSTAFFTPFVVARRVAALLTGAGASRILDVGGGAGKVCIIGALTTGATFTGVEQRGSLVDAGQAAIRAFGIERAHLVRGTLSGVDFDAYDGLYFFNPFEENFFAAEQQLDHSVALSESRFDADVALVERALERAKVGTCVVTFNGFGGFIPATYKAELEQTRGNPLLRLWVKVEEGGYAPEGTFDGFYRS